MLQHRRFSWPFFAIILLGSLISAPACTQSAGPSASLKEIDTAPLSFTIGHISDTHTYVTPYEYMLKINGRDTIALVGGYSLLMPAIEELRGQDKNLLLLHAGDLLEGTIWTPTFGGLADCDCLNVMNFDALVPGNHDFSRGASELAAMVKQLKFPVLAANLDASNEPSLAGRIKPYLVKEIGGQKVGIIGLITPDTVWMNQPGNSLVFSNPADAARRCIAQLNEQGVNKIIMLSHLGYDADRQLAGAVSGIDVIIGGHSHTFMGGPEFEQLALHPDMPYPTVIAGPSGDKVLIAHAWEYNRLLGVLKLDFDEKGRISSFTGQPRIYATDRYKLEDPWGWNYLCPCRQEYGEISQAIRGSAAFRTFYDDHLVTNALQPYSRNLPGDTGVLVAIADENLFRGLNRGPGPLIADAFLQAGRKANPAAAFSIYASRNIRNDIYKGEVTLEEINLLVPLRQRLATVTAGGSTIKWLMETIYDGHVRAGVPPPYLETSGLYIAADLARKSGERILSLQVRDKDGAYRDIQPEAEYTFVTTDLQVEIGVREVAGRLPLPPMARERAAGWLMSYLRFNNLGLKDVDVVADYCRFQKNLKNITEERTTLIRAPRAAAE